MNSSQGSGSWSLLDLSRCSRWLWQDSSFSQEDDMTVLEFLFQFTGQLSLNLVETSQRWDWNKNGQSLLTTSNVDFSDGLELQRSQLSFQFWRRIFQFNE